MVQKSEDDASKDKDTSEKIKDSDSSILKISGGVENGNMYVKMECESVNQRLSCYKQRPV